MTTQIQSVHFDADQKLLDFVLEKVEKLDKFYNRIENANVILRLNKNDKSKNKIAEIELLVPGTKLFAYDLAEHFEVATDLAVEELIKQLKKHKEKEEEKRKH